MHINFRYFLLLSGCTIAYPCPHGWPPAFLIKRTRTIDLAGRLVDFPSLECASLLSAITGVPPLASRKIQLPDNCDSGAFLPARRKQRHVDASYVATRWVPVETFIFWSTAPVGLVICCSNLHVAIHRNLDFVGFVTATLAHPAKT